MKSVAPLLEISAKGFLGLGLIISSLWILEQNDAFANEFDPNNHREKRWNYLYKMAEQETPIDVLVMGNSHAYTGVSPEFLSGALECNAFILANNASNVADVYWNLRELLKIHSPSVVALETYTIDNRNHSEMAPDFLAHQIRAFNTRKDPDIRRESFFSLFPMDDIPLAVSDVVRNHHYTWEGFPMRPKPQPVNYNKRYLGRFIRFTTGITDSLLATYDELGASVDGANRLISDECVDYSHRILRLCKENGIELMLFTLPMYEKHVKNSHLWMQRYDSLARELDVPYLDLQTRTDMASRPEYFENTRTANQHMTLTGSIRAADELAMFIDSMYPGKLHQRAGEETWQQYHRANQGIYAYSQPAPGAEEVKFLAQDLIAPDFDIDQFMLADVPNNPDIQEIWVRLDNFKNGARHGNRNLNVQFDYQFEGQPVSNAVVQIPRYASINRDSIAVFMKTVRKIDIKKIKAAALADVP